MLTLPSSPSELQDDFGLREKGAFVVSVRNPATPAPPYAGIPALPGFSQPIKDAFDGKRWGAVTLEHLAYKHTELLFIGERHFPEDGEHEATATELARLEDEDETRIKHLSGKCLCERVARRRSNKQMLTGTCRGGRHLQGPRIEPEGVPGCQGHMGARVGLR